MNTKISIRNFEVKYGSNTALELEELCFDGNFKTAILGANGAGKSTLVKSILGIEKYNGYIGSDFQISDIGTQLQTNPYSQHIKVKELIILVYNKHALKSDLFFTFGINTYSNTLVGKLSGGQKQKLDLFLAMYKDPKLLILDEPSSGLDYDSRMELMSLIKTNRMNKNLILVSHYFEEIVELTTSIIILKNGKLLFHGTNDDLISLLDDVFCYDITDLEDTEVSKYKHIKIEQGRIIGFSKNEITGALIVKNTLQLAYQFLLLGGVC